MNIRAREVFARVAAVFMPRCYAGDAAGDSATAVEDPPPANASADAAAAPVSSPTQDPAPKDTELPFGKLGDDYWQKPMGSKTVNPDSRPLRPDVRLMAKDDELDDIVTVMGDAAFMTAKEIAAYEKAKGAPAAKTADGKSAPDGEKKEGDDEDVAKFYETTGFTAESFGALPKEAQERIVKLHEARTGTDPEREKLTKDVNESKLLIDQMRSDPVIRARLQEVQDNKRYVATALPEVTASEFSQELLKSLELSDDERTLLVADMNRLLKAKTSAAVKAERSVLDREVSLDKNRRDAWGVICEVGKIDKRLEVADPEKAYNNPPDASTEVGKLVKFVADSKFTLEQIKTLGPKKLHALYAAEVGWDTQREQQIVKTERKSLLEKLNNPKKATMKSIPQGKPPLTSGSSIAGTELDDEGLVNELLAGKQQTIERLLALNANNPDAIERIKAIQGKARQRYMERRRNRSDKREDDE